MRNSVPAIRAARSASGGSPAAPAGETGAAAGTRALVSMRHLLFAPGRLSSAAGNGLLREIDGRPALAGH